MARITDKHYRDTRAATAALMRAKRERLEKGIRPSKNMRYILNDAAYEIVKGMTLPELREFVSAAILHKAKVKGKKRI